MCIRNFNRNGVQFSCSDIFFDYINVVGLSRRGSSGSRSSRSRNSGYRSASSRTNVDVKIDTKPRYGGGYMNRDFNEAARGGSRGGGGYRSGSGSYRSGSGGYRSGSSRTNVKVKVKIDSKSRYGGGYRGVSYTRIGYSTKYTTWSRYHGFSPSFRYRTSNYYYKSRGISMGLIFMSHRHRSTFIVHRESSYDDISICYNEFPLYDRNISVSPWFVCPWDDPNERYCCGDEIEERCCAYSKSGNIAGLVVGILFLIAIIISIIVCCCCCRRKKRRAEMNMVIVETSGVNKQEQITLMPTNQVQYPPTMAYQDCPQPMAPNPPYPMTNDYNQPPPQVNYAPYPPANTCNQGYAPYPVNPPNPTATDLNQQNPSMPLTQLPPSYSDVVRN